MSNSLQNLQFVIFCMHAFIVGFFLLIRRIRSRTCLVKFLLSKSFKHVLTLSLEQHVSSCILFVTLVLDRSVIVDILWYLLWYPLISINIRVDIHCYPHWFLYDALSLSQLIVGAKGKQVLSNMNIVRFCCLSVSSVLVYLSVCQTVFVSCQLLVCNVYVNDAVFVLQ